MRTHARTDAGPKSLRSGSSKAWPAPLSFPAFPFPTNCANSLPTPPPPPPSPFRLRTAAPARAAGRVTLHFVGRGRATAGRGPTGDRAVASRRRAPALDSDAAQPWRRRRHRRRHRRRAGWESDAAGLAGSADGTVGSAARRESPDPLPGAARFGSGPPSPADTPQAVAAAGRSMGVTPRRRRSPSPLQGPPDPGPRPVPGQGLGIGGGPARRRA